jgi:hypothetical protein
LSFVASLLEAGEISRVTSHQINSQMKEELLSKNGKKNPRFEPKYVRVTYYPSIG